MPKVKHNILRWAREKTKLSIEEAAQKLSLKDTQKMSAAEKLYAFETGDPEPSRSLLLRMSKQYRLPLLAFYLDKPPRIGDRGEDFRTLPDYIDEIDNTNVDVLIRDIKARQITIRETLIDADEKNVLTFIGKHKVEDGAKLIVQTIQEVLKTDLDDYRHQANYKEAFKFLREQVEAAGIFVILKGNLGSYHSNIPISVFRGFALSDNIAPFIVINDQDSESAWSFTLIHEMAHLILGQTGISGAYFNKKIEQFCNEVASEFMLPETEFEKFVISGTNINNLKSEISDYAFSLKLSSTHIAYRLYKRGEINKVQWDKLSKFFRDKWIEGRDKQRDKNKRKDGGPDYYVIKNYKLGNLVDLVQRLTFAGEITTTKAGMLLDIRPLKVHRLFQTE